MLKKLRSFFSNYTLFFELLAVIIITIPAYTSLINPFYFSMHDDQHIARLFLLDKGIHQGYIFPRWVDTLGFNFGYPLFNFYPPLVYYIGEVFHLIGFSFATSIKLVFITGFIVGGIGMYLLAKRHLGRFAGFLASILYTYFFYHAVLIYVRGALAEFFTLAILPFVFLALDHLRENLTLRESVIFGSLFALLILTHPLIAVPFIFYLVFTYVFYLLIVKKRMRFTVLLGTGVLTVILLSSFFWLPSMIERRFTLVDSILTRELANYKIHFVCIGQLLNSPWGYGGSIAGCFDGLTFQLGKMHIVLILFSGLIAFWYATRKKRVSVNFEHFTYFMFLLLFSIFMTVENSKAIWDSLSYLWYLQFPWRFFTFTALFISMVGAFGLHYLQRLLTSYDISPKKILATQMIFLIVVGGLVIVIYQKYFHPSTYLAEDDIVFTSFYEIADRVSHTSFEFSPIGVKTKKTELGTTAFDISARQIPQKRYELKKGRADIALLTDKFQEKILQVNAQEPSVVQLNTFFFPGWTYRLDGERGQINSNNPYRLIVVKIPKGIHNLTFNFEDKPIRKVADWISGLTLLAVLSFFGFQLKKRKA